MKRFLKYDTSGHFLVGPIIKSTDGYTPLTGIASGSLDMWYAIDTSTYDYATADIEWNEVADGIYDIGYTTNITRTVGAHLMLSIGASSGIPIWEEAEILPADAYDQIHTTADYFGAATGHTVDGTITLGDLYKVLQAYSLGDSTYDGATAMYYDHGGTTFFKFAITTASRSRST
jgi:hypothetical protein